MARTPTGGELKTRTTRNKLEAGKRHWLKLEPGVSLGYRKPKSGPGAWSVRVLLEDGREPMTTIGHADDFEDAGTDPKMGGTLSYAQAVRMAHDVADYERKPAHLKQGPMTVGGVITKYIEHYAATGGKDLTGTRTTVEAHILPKLGDVQVSGLTPALLKNWLDGIAKSPPRVRTKSGWRPDPNWTPTPDKIRARQASANRVRTVLIAALNFGFQAGLIADDSAWRKTKPYRNADQPVVQFLEPDDCVRLINACDADFRQVVRAGLLTGARWGELRGLKVGDVQLSNGGLWFHGTKGGKSRFVHLNAEGVEFFSQCVLGKNVDDCVLLRGDGSPWGEDQQVRRFADGLSRAGLPGHFSFHDLRHSFASMLIQSGVAIEVISDLLGHADTRITLRHYAHMVDRVRKEAVAMLPSFGLEPSNISSLRKRNAR